MLYRTWRWSTTYCRSRSRRPSRGTGPSPSAPTWNVASGTSASRGASRASFSPAVSLRRESLSLSSSPPLSPSRPLAPSPALRPQSLSFWSPLFSRFFFFTLSLSLSIFLLLIFSLSYNSFFKCLLLLNPIFNKRIICAWFSILIVFQKKKKRTKWIILFT